ncbi:hypothetical protein RDWZM_005050 [Blomia tropicalis]|uniref:Uncharacterized protein n=1 Tax=Blomia tropicalis TaxID=40697 RepID=A0A9Q0M5Y6_BLOTA|nr:hypothetical protein RDWZM_005050 [Blomia tropicalis]
MSEDFNEKEKKILEKIGLKKNNSDDSEENQFETHCNHDTSQIIINTNGESVIKCKSPEHHFIDGAKLISFMADQSEIKDGTCGSSKNNVLITEESSSSSDTSSGQSDIVKKRCRNKYSDDGFKDSKLGISIYSLIHHSLKSRATKDLKNKSVYEEFKRLTKSTRNVIKKSNSIDGSTSDVKYIVLSQINQKKKLQENQEEAESDLSDDNVNRPNTSMTSTKCKTYKKVKKELDSMIGNDLVQKYKSSSNITSINDSDHCYAKPRNSLYSVRDTVSPDENDENKHDFLMKQRNLNLDSYKCFPKIYNNSIKIVSCAMSSVRRLILKEYKPAKSLEKSKYSIKNRPFLTNLFRFQLVKSNHLFFPIYNQHYINKINLENCFRCHGEDIRDEKFKSLYSRMINVLTYALELINTNDRTEFEEDQFTFISTFIVGQTNREAIDDLVNKELPNNLEPFNLWEVIQEIRKPSMKH